MTKTSKKAKRPVDKAMRAVRSEKSTVRGIWIDVLKSYDKTYGNPEELLYVTLPGAEGLEIDLLAKSNLISLTETGGISQESMSRVAAIESNKLAVGALQKKFPGLKIYETDFKSLIRGDGLINYPDGEHRSCCRARIINLDLNEVLNVSQSGNSFPILIWIQKLGEMHALAPRLDWCLYLTLHGEIRWVPAIGVAVRDFLRENFLRSAKFSESARDVLGGELHELIRNGGGVDFSNLNRPLQQKILMLFVPKKIADLVRGQMWKVSTHTNLRYGQLGQAPMVTWIIDFKYDPRAIGTPDAVYLESVGEILDSAGEVLADGSLVRDLND